MNNRHEKAKTSLIGNIFIDIFILTILIFVILTISIDNFPKNIIKSFKKDTQYIINSKDDLNGIANKYNVSILDIAAANNLKDINRLSSGRILLIPNNITAGDKAAYLAEMERTIDERKSEIEDSQRYLEKLQARIKSSENEIDDLFIEIKYPNSGTVSKYAIDKFNGKKKTYNNMLETYKTEYKELEKKIPELNKLVRQFNSLTDNAPGKNHYY